MCLAMTRALCKAQAEILRGSNVAGLATMLIAGSLQPPFYASLPAPLRWLHLLCKPLRASCFARTSGTYARCTHHSIILAESDADKTLRGRDGSTDSGCGGDSTSFGDTASQVCPHLSLRQGTPSIDSDRQLEPDTPCTGQKRAGSLSLSAFLHEGPS